MTTYAAVHGPIPRTASNAQLDKLRAERASTSPEAIRRSAEAAIPLGR